MGFRCAHFADIHFRGLTRHAEYREVFSRIFTELKKQDLDAIYIGGDIVHSKTQGISPELIEVLVWWFKGLAEIAPLHVILGNHDGLILNKDRQDAITPIIQAINSDNIFLYKDSGTYPIKGHDVNWCVFSCFDESSWKEVKPVPGMINIALFHGPVQGSKVDSDWEIDEPNQITVDFFKEFDFTFLGDIHKSQFLDPEKRVAYCGSTIQQNYGEDLEKGFMIWDIESSDVYKTEFIPVANRKSFYTISWEDNIQKTLSKLEKAMSGGRFRVRSKKSIPQAEIKQLFNELRETYKATEVVFKWDIEEKNEEKIQIGDTLIEEGDLSSPSTHVKLMNEYTKTFVLNDDERQIVENITKKIASEAVKNSHKKNVKWSIKKLKFNNTFGYGSNNAIDFDKLNGITGIFGKNRTGKSSIPGTIMYGLYNTTDRGSIKNLHIINSRKGFCNVEIDMNINGKPYRVERQSVKHTTKAGVTNASTSLNLWKIDPLGQCIEDLSGEQRRETEKDLKDLVGNSEDFLLTSLASQGGMNNFIRNGATVRKSILTKFLDLGVFEKMLNIAKTEFSELRGLMKSAPDRDWSTLIRSRRLELESLTSEREEVEQQIQSIREEVHSTSLLLATHENSESFTEEEINYQKEKIDSLKETSLACKGSIKDYSKKVSEIETRLSKISQIKNQFPIEELKEKISHQREIESSMQSIEHDLEREKTLLKSQKKCASTLEVVPCGDQFPKCKFIKDSHSAKKNIPNQEIQVSEIKKKFSLIKKNLRSILNESLEEKIEKYENVLKKESESRLERSSAIVQLREFETQDTKISQNISEEFKKLSKMKLNASQTTESVEVARLRNHLKNIQEKARFLDAEKLSASEKIGLIQQQLSDFEKEKLKYSELKKKWNAYNAFLQAVDKKGIPLKIMSIKLPQINQEIEKILQGVVEFTVEIQAESGSNSLDVFINYGDSKRIIECASGMEKMLASLAIRVALINVSNLPKSDMIIIDEGFGTLDAVNVEACNRLLVSLKKWFRHIFVISHIDAVKDTVDNVLDIRKKGKNSLIVYE